MKKYTVKINGSGTKAEIICALKQVIKDFSTITTEDAMRLKNKTLYAEMETK